MLAWRVAALAVLGCGLAAGQDRGPVTPPRTVEISNGVMAGNLLTKVQPVYPAEAKAQGIQGAVVLRAVIGTDGAVQNLTVVSGNSLLAAAALDAVRQWTYKPYLLNGEAVAVRTTVTVNFAFEGLRPPTSGSSPDVVSADVMADNTIKKVDPIYPPIAKAAKIQGAVLLDVVIRSDGTVESIKVISGSSLLQGAAVDAVKQWVYRPYLVDGVPTRIETTVMVNFALTT